MNNKIREAMKKFIKEVCDEMSPNKEIANKTYENIIREYDKQTGYDEEDRKENWN